MSTSIEKYLTKSLIVTSRIFLEAVITFNYSVINNFGLFEDFLSFFSKYYVTGEYIIKSVDQITN